MPEAYERQANTYLQHDALDRVGKIGVKEGLRAPRGRLGYIHAVDVVPTFCHILETPAPAQSQGTVVGDLFESYEMLR